MGVVIRQSIKGSIVSYAGVLLGLVNMLWLFPQYLDPDEIGLYKLVLDASLLFLIFAQLGTSPTLVRFFPHFRDAEGGHKGIFNYAVLMPLLGFALFTIAFILFKDQILAQYTEQSPMVADFYYMLLPLTFFLMMFRVFEIYAQSLYRIVVSKILKEIGLRLVLMAVLMLFVFHVLNFREFMWAVVASYGLAVILLLVYIRTLGPIAIRPGFKHFSRDLVKEMAVFTGYMLLGSGGNIIVAKIDTLMVGSLQGLEATGIYGIAASVALLIELPKRALSSIASPVVAQAFKDNAMATIAEIYRKSSLNMMIGGGLVFAGIWCNTDALFLLIPNGEVYAAGKYVVLFIALAKLTDMSMGINVEVLANSPYYRWNIFLMPLLAVVTIGTNYLLIPAYGITGAAIATLSSIAAYNLIRFVLVWRLLGTQPFTWGTVGALAAITGMVVIGTVIPALDNPLLDILYRSTVICTIFGTYLLVFRPSSDIDAVITGMINKLRNRR